MKKSTNNDGIQLVNLTDEPVTVPQQSRFITADEIAEEIHCSKSYAYKFIRRINAEMDKKGYITMSGRTLRSAWIAKTGGM